MAQRTTFTLPQIILHWLIAVLIVGAYIGGDGMGRVLDQRIAEGWTGIEGNTPHVWVGGTVFALVLIRIVLRLIKGAPPPVPGTPPLMVRAAHAGHLLIYALMVAVPAAGAAAWYVKIPAAGDVHEILGTSLIVVALGHAVVAILHEAQKPGGMLVRMVRPSR